MDKEDSIKKYLKVREELSVLDDKMKKLKEEKSSLEDDLIAHLESGNKVVQYFGNKIELIRKVDARIYDEDALISDMSSRRDKDYIGEFTKMKLDTVKFKSFQKKELKEGRSLFDGVEMVDSRSIRVTTFFKGMKVDEAENSDGLQ